MGFSSGIGISGLAIAAAMAVGVLASCAAPEDSIGSEPRAVVSRPAKAPAKPQAKASGKAAARRVVTETRRISFKRRTVRDPAADEGTTVVRTRGVNGSKRLTYEVTLVGGRQTGKRLLRTVITKRPVTQVTAVGTRARPEPASDCDPNYSGCVPVASDVDCAGGSGNGPAYVSGLVRVIGSDVYGLERDSDGIGCED